MGVRSILRIKCDTHERAVAINPLLIEFIDANPQYTIVYRTGCIFTIEDGDPVEALEALIEAEAIDPTKEDTFIL